MGSVKERAAKAAENVKAGATAMFGELKAIPRRYQEKKAEREAERERQHAEELRAQREALEKERERLCALNDKELMVELIFAVRGLYDRLRELEEEEADLNARVRDLEIRMDTEEEQFDTD